MADDRDEGFETQDERRAHDRTRLIVDVFFDGQDVTGVASTSTSHTSHSVKTTTFSIAVTANTTATIAGTAMPTMSAPRFKRGYQRINRAAWSEM